MPSLILRTTTRFMMPLLLLFSLFLLWRGHNEPGGGFVGGLVGASAFILYTLSFSVQATRDALAFDSRSLIGVGLMLALTAGIMPLTQGQPFLAHRNFWVKLELPGFGQLDLGTPLMFDIGVYLVVFGVALTIVLTLTEE